MYPAIEYVFEIGDHVYCFVNGKNGQVTSCVPGNGTMPWYFVEFEDGTEDRFTKDDLEKR